MFVSCLQHILESQLKKKKLEKRFLLSEFSIHRCTSLRNDAMWNSPLMSEFMAKH